MLIPFWKFFPADNLNGAQILGRIIRVDHVSKYKKKEEEDEETERQKREARGICRAFQKGECNRGAGCKFSHDEQVCFVVTVDQLCFSSLTYFILTTLTVEVTSLLGFLLVLLSLFMNENGLCSAEHRMNKLIGK